MTDKKAAIEAWNDIGTMTQAKWGMSDSHVNKCFHLVGDYLNNVPEVVTVDQITKEPSPLEFSHAAYIMWNYPNGIRVIE